jgi:GT2 family glycosyltransferase
VSAVQRLRAQLNRADLALRDIWLALRAARIVWRREGARAVIERAARKLAAWRPVWLPSPSEPAWDPLLSRTTWPPLVLPDASDPAVSIVVPAHGAYAYTRVCLERIADAGVGVAYEVIVVDDASTDATASLEREVANLRVVRNATNLGFVDSANRGAAAARGRLLVFLNNDTAVEPGWLDAIVDTFARHPDAGIVGARLLHANGRLQEAGAILWRDGSGWNFGRDDDADAPAYAYLRDTDYVSGACLAIPRALFQELGGFDARYRPGYYEDADLAFRVRERGLRVLYQPAARVLHFEGATAGRDLGSGMKRHQVENRDRFVARWSERLAAHFEPPPAGDARRAAQRGRRAHVLVVDARVPRPEHDAGSLRMVRLLDLMRELGCAVTLLPMDRAAPGPASEALAQAGVEVFTRRWMRSVPHHLRTYGTRYDLVVLSHKHVAHKFLAHARRHCPQARIVFDTVDLEFLREARAIGVVGGDARHAERLEQEEIALVRAADVTLVVSEAERARLLHHVPAADVRVVSTVHELHPPGAPFAARRGGLFIASFEHAPNADAIRWYLDEIHERVRALLPDFELSVIGTDAPQWLLAWKQPGVRVLGPVPDLDAPFGAARLSIAPLRFGAGVKGKINTSQSYGVPVVATAVGAEGMQLVHGESVWVADSPDAFAAGIARVHEDEALWGRLAEGSRRNLAEHFSTARARSAIEALLAERGSAGRTPLRG